MSALVIDQLTKTYSSGHLALDSVSFEVAQGDFFALLGPNGAGKSTLINILVSLVRKTSGSASVMGYNIDTQVQLAKACIGLVPQEFNFSPFETPKTIIFNQAGYYGITRRKAKTRLEHFLKRLGLWDKKDGQARLLSGGMKRRLMIARALIHQPKVLILDEPTAGVDIELRHLLWDYLRELNATGTTIILTTHYLEEAEQLCKNLAIIDQGRIIELTSMKNFLAKLESETYEIVVQEELPTHLKLKSFKFKRVDAHTLQVGLKSGQLIGDLFNELTTSKLTIESIQNKTHRLEELFLKLTAS